MIQYERYSVKHIFDIMDSKQRMYYQGRSVGLNSARLVLFRTKGCTCVRCGVEGNVFILETHRKEVGPHLNLYAELPDGKLILITKDHIVPRSRGGANSLANYQTMCTKCNIKKGSSLE